MERLPPQSVPNPDPTALTTENLRREISSLEKLFNEQLGRFAEVSAEKFSSVKQQFDLVEQQRVEQKADTKQAVDAALTAQKEAVKEQTTASERAIAKSEAATTKQLDQQSTTFNTLINGVTNAFNDLKERVTKLEAVKLGGSEVRQQNNVGISQILSTIAVIVSTIAVFLHYSK